MSATKADFTVSMTDAPREPGVAVPIGLKDAGFTEPSAGMSVKYLLLAIIPVSIVYLLLLNPYWVPSGDGEVYTAIARAMARGDGFMVFNGAKAAIVPPGWPLVLAGLMKISPEFLFLKFCQSAFMVASLGVMFYIVRRYLSDLWSALTIILAGTLSSVYILTQWMHTEAFFCLIGAASVLLALRIGEGRGAWKHVIALGLLLALASFTRWPGVLHILLVVPALLRGSIFKISAVRWSAVVVSIVACVGTFALTYELLKLTPEERKIARAAGAMEEREGGDETADVDETTTMPATTQAVEIPETDDELPPAINTFAQRDPERTVVEEYLFRVGQSGKWFSWLLWQPTRFGQSVAPISMSGQAAGWLSIVLLCAALVRTLAKKDYFFLGLAMYTGGLIVVWPLPNARYYVPVAPFIIAGVIVGIHAMILVFRSASVLRFGKILAWTFVASLAVVNGTLLAIDVYVFQSGDKFYETYEAGANRDLVAAAQYIRANPAGGRIAASERYVNMGRRRWSKLSIRAMHLLLDRPVIAPPRTDRMNRRPRSSSTDPVVRWARRKNVEWYIHQPINEPWRVWHFRLSPEFQKRLTGIAIEHPSGGWELFQRRGRGLAPIPLGELKLEPVRRVPGL